VCVGKVMDSRRFFYDVRKEVAVHCGEKIDMEFVIKEIDRVEQERRAEIIRRSFGTVAQQLGIENEDSPARQTILAGKKTGEESDQSDLVYGAYTEIDGKETMVGSAQITKKEDGVYVLKKLAVLPAYRHNGIGRALIGFGCDEVRKRGGTILRITVIEADTVLKNWYLKLGFKHMGTEKYTHLPYTVGQMEYTL